MKKNVPSGDTSSLPNCLSTHRWANHGTREGTRGRGSSRRETHRKKNMRVHSSPADVVGLSRTGEFTRKPCAGRIRPTRVIAIEHLRNSIAASSFLLSAPGLVRPLPPCCGAVATARVRAPPSLASTSPPPAVRRCAFGRAVHHAV